MCSLLVATFAAHAQATPPSHGPPPDPPRLAILTAMELEMAPIRAATTVSGTRVINGRTITLGQLGGHDVALVVTSPSMVNAAMMTQAVLDQCNIRGIVFSGIAGGVNPSLRVGDVAIPARWGNYQELVFARETPAGFETNRTDLEFGNYKGMFPAGTNVAVAGARPDSIARRFWFAADSAALALARTATSALTMQRCTASGDCLEHTPRVVAGGSGVSGPTFVDNAAYREWVWSTFHADALDMETAAVAIVAYQAGVPYIAFRGLSDLAGGGGTRNTVRSLGRLAAANAAAAAIAYVQALPLHSDSSRTATDLPTHRSVRQ